MTDDIHKTVFNLTTQTDIVQYETIRGTSYAWQITDSAGNRTQKTSSAWRSLADAVYAFENRTDFERGIFK
jgi:hypothetical protein